MGVNLAFLPLVRTDHNGWAHQKGEVVGSVIFRKRFEDEYKASEYTHRELREQHDAGFYKLYDEHDSKLAKHGLSADIKHALDKLKTEHTQNVNALNAKHNKKLEDMQSAFDGLVGKQHK